MTTLTKLFIVFFEVTMYLLLCYGPLTLCQKSKESVQLFKSSPDQIFGDASNNRRLQIISQKPYFPGSCNQLECWRYYWVLYSCAFSATLRQIHSRKWPKTLKNGKKWPKNGFLTSKMNFSEHVTNRKVVDNGLFYLNMHFQPNPWQHFWEKSKKPSKMAIFAKKKFL